MSNVAGRDALRQSPVVLVKVDRKPGCFIYAPPSHGYAVIEPYDDRSFDTLRAVMKAYATPGSGNNDQRRNAFYDAVTIHNYLATGQQYWFQSASNRTPYSSISDNYGNSYYLVTVSGNDTLDEELLFNEADMPKSDLYGALIANIHVNIQKLANLFALANHPADFETLSKAAIYLIEKRLEITSKMEAP